MVYKPTYNRGDHLVLRVGVPPNNLLLSSSWIVIRIPRVFFRHASWRDYRWHSPSMTTLPLVGLEDTLCRWKFRHGGELCGLQIQFHIPYNLCQTIPSVIPADKPTYLLNIAHWWFIYPLNIVIFHSYVRLPEAKWNRTNTNNLPVT